MATEDCAILLKEGEDPYVSPHIRAKSHLLYVKIASFWCAFQLSQTSLGTVVWPSQIAAIIDDPSLKDLYNGFIPSPGAFVSLIVAPIAGYLSDHFEFSFGRRKFFMLLGSLLVILLQFCMATFSGHSSRGSIYIFMFLICVYQFGSQLATGPYSGLLPDLVHKSRTGAASGWLGVGLAVGVIIGSVGAGVLVDIKAPHSYWYPYLYLTIMFAIFAAVTIIGVNEIPRPAVNGEFSWKTLWHTFYLDPAHYRNFYWVIFTRTLYDMGLYSILPFLSYYFEDIIKSESPSLMTSAALGIIIFASIPASLISGYLSDRLGRKTMVYISTAIMAGGSVVLAALSMWCSSLVLTFVVGTILGGGYGCYTAVDWALAIDCLPPNANVAKDLGIWHLSVVLPQVIAPVIAGTILTTMKKKFNVHSAYGTFFMVVFMWFVLAFIYTYFIEVPKRVAPPTEEEKKSETGSDDELRSSLG